MVDGGFCRRQGRAELAFGNHSSAAFLYHLKKITFSLKKKSGGINEH
jgi:hypothetical protein